MDTSNFNLQEKYLKVSVTLSFEDSILVIANKLKDLDEFMEEATRYQVNAKKSTVITGDLQNRNI